MGLWQSVIDHSQRKQTVRLPKKKGPLMLVGRGRGVARTVVAVAIALAGALGASSSDGAEVEVENLRVGFASNQQNNMFKVGTWTPVWVQLKGGSERFTGVMEVEVPDDDGTPTFFRQVVDVPPSASVRVVTYARPGSRDPDFTIRLFDQRGRRHGPAVEGSRIAQLGPVQSDESLLLTMGKTQGVELIPALPAFSSEKRGGGREVVVGRGDGAGGLPGRWYGYDAAETVVVDTNDKDVMAEVGIRGQALVDWVARGGHLVVAIGGNWASVKDSVLGPLLPAVPSGQERLTSLDMKALEVYAGASKQFMPPGSGSVQVTKLESIESRGGKVLSASGEVPLVVRGTFGFGRVTLVALDVDQKPFSEWPDRAQFWVRALDFRRQSGTEGADGSKLAAAGTQIYQSGVSDLATQLRMSLEQFPGVKLIPFGWVAFFIFLYILLIGPGDYLFLKKVVKRMEMTWVTFPLIVLTVSLVAYFAAYLVKGRDLRVNKVDVVDVDLASGKARGSSFVNIFSPENRDYDVQVVPLSLDESMRAGATVPAASERESSASGSTRQIPAGTEVLLTWMGVPEAGFGGMGGSGKMGFNGGGYASTPAGSSEALEGVRVPIWSTKLLTARWYGSAPEVAESDLLPVGLDRLSGTVTNRLGVTLKDALVVYGKHVYELGDFTPNQEKRVELASRDRQLSPLLKSRRAGGSGNNLDSAAASRVSRSDLMLTLMFHDSQNMATSDRPLASNPLHYLDLTGQLALDRPMLVGRVDRPASRLVLGNTPSPPKVDQTTMLRVILPLGKPPAEGEAK